MFNQKSAVLFGKSQIAAGTMDDLSGADALACVDVSFSPVFQNETYTYTGDVNDRDVSVDQVDKYGKLDFSTLIPVLGGDALGAANLTLAIHDWLKSCGAQTSVGANGELIFSNDLLFPVAMSQEFRRSDSKSTDDKVFELWDVLSQLGVDISANKRGTLKFTAMGEYDKAEDKPHLVADYGGQKTFAAPASKKESRTVTWKGLQCCPETFSTSNFFGVSLDRFRLACESGTDIAAEASEVSMQILEKHASDSFNPENHILSTGKLSYKIGTAAGKIVLFEMDDLLLLEWQPSQVGNFAGQSLKFTNKGKSRIIFK